MAEETPAIRTRFNGDHWIWQVRISDESTGAGIANSHAEAMQFAQAFIERGCKFETAVEHA